MMEKMAENTLDPEDLQASKVKTSGTEQESSKINRQKILTIEQKKATQQIYIKDKKLELMTLDEKVKVKEQKMCTLQNLGEEKRRVLNEYLINMRRKPKDAEELLEKAIKDKLETSVMIERLFDETRTLKSELNKIEDVRNRYKWYKAILLKLSPYEWLEAKDAEALTAKIVQKEEVSEPKGLASSNSLVHSPEKEVSSTSESTLSSTANNTEVKHSTLDNYGDGDELGIYYSDPTQVVVLLSELTDQILSLVHNATEMDKDLEKTIEFTMEKMMEDEKKLMFQVKDMMDRVERERSRTDMLKKKVQLHDLLRTQDQDIMLAALGNKVTKVHASCTDSRFTHLNTLEQLCSIEYRISLLVQQIEAIPEEIFKELWQIKEAERKSRLREEKLRLEREKQMERTKKCMERSLGESKKKKTGRKPMPRCMPVKQKISVIDEPAGPAEDELHADLFSEGFD